ncbi:MAG TPA: 50S ribosomal protein L11 methyltransferase [Ktedonobacteraceae bacterium]|jgi:ribosomal protein L11 methyltransferase
MRWLELTVQVHPEAVESVSELLRRYSSDGVVIEEPFELTEDGQDYRVLYGQPVKIHAYIPIDGKEEATRQQVELGLWHLSSLGAHFVGELQTRVVDEEDWANAWKDYYHVTHIGQRLVIRPSWREYTPREHEVVVTLDPGMAFGTGVHPTTRMCLVQVEQRVQPGMRILDVGTGSAILALAAAKLGAQSVDAIDNSSVAAECATANVAMNNLEDRIRVVLGVLDEVEAERMAGQYDLVLANIIAQVIGLIAPHLAQVLAPQGMLVVSGIIEARRHDAEGPLLESGLQLVEEVKIDDWLALVYTKRG